MTHAADLKRILVALSLALSGAFAWGQQPKRITPTFESRSKAFIKGTKEGWAFVTENSKFEFASIEASTPGSWTNLLLEATFRNETFPQGEGMRGDGIVKVWTLRPGRPRSLRWTLRTLAHEGQTWDRMLKLTTFGCCATPTTYQYHSLLTGKLLYVSHGDLVQIRGGEEGGDVSMRFVAFGFEESSQEGQSPVIQYGTDLAPPAQVEVLSSKECHFMDLPKVSLEVDGAAVENLDLYSHPLTFVVVLRYPDGAEVRLPIVNDHPQVEGATVPPGFSLRLRPRAAETAAKP